MGASPGPGVLEETEPLTKCLVSVSEKQRRYAKKSTEPHKSPLTLAYQKSLNEHEGRRVKPEGARDVQNTRRKHRVACRGHPPRPAALSFTNLRSGQFDVSQAFADQLARLPTRSFFLKLFVGRLHPRPCGMRCPISLFLSVI